MTIEIFKRELIDTIRVHNREKENNERILLYCVFGFLQCVIYRLFKYSYSYQNDTL